MTGKHVRNTSNMTIAERLYLDKPLVHGVLIALLCLAAYSNTFHVPFQFDDPTNISDRPSIRHIGSLLSWGGLTQPRSVTYLTFAVNYWLHGTNVLGYHLFNLAIHIANALLLYGLVVLSFGTPVLRGSSLKPRAQFIALFSALLFAGHPIQTQAVTYIVQRLASLSTLFYLASLVSYGKARLSGAENPPRMITPAWYAASLVAAILAMKSKETAFTLPVIISLYEFLFFEGTVKKRIFMLIPFLLTMAIIPASMLGAGESLGNLVGDVSKVTRLQSDTTRMDYLLTEFTVIVTYLRLLFFPADQNLDYDYPVYHSFFAPAVALSFLLLVLIAGLGIYILYRDRRSPNTGSLLAFGIFWFFMTLSVESSIIPIADVIFEHRLYLPSAGFFLTVTSALFLGADRLRARWIGAEKAVLIALAAAVIVFGGLAHARNSVWQSEMSLWEDVLQKSPLKARGYNGLGLAYYNKQQYDEAIGAFARAIELYPTYASAYNNLGNTLYWKGLYDNAIEAQSRALALSPNNAIFYDNRGLSRAAKGEFDRAIEDYERALRLDPFFTEAHHNLGFAYHCRGQYREAIEEYSKSIALEPDNAKLYSNRALSYTELGELEPAIEDYNRAIALDPGLDAAYSGRGAARGLRGEFDLAIADFSRAISLNPRNAVYYVNRGVAHARAGHRSEAASDFQRACDEGDQGACRMLSL